MKTAIKITALAVITVLAVLSCTPAVELTARDYGEYKDQYKAEYTNTNSRLSGTGITFPGSNPYYTDPAPVSDASKEITVSFPEDADVLKSSNADILAELKKFLTFNTYTDPTASPGEYKKSNLVSELDYSFVQRTGGNTITVRLSALPTTKVAYIVAKIDASQYKRYGQLIDTNGDGKGGEVYDDFYQVIGVDNNSGATAPSAYFLPPVVTVNLSTRNQGLGGQYSTTPPPTAYIAVAEFETLGTSVPAAELRKILDGIKTKFSLQKYDKAANTWSDVTAPIAVFNPDSPPAGVTGITPSNCLYFTLSTFENLGIYRLKAKEIANLQSSYNIGDQPAKISVNNSFLYENWYSDPNIFIDSKYMLNYQDENSLFSFNGGVSVISDANKQNVVLEWSIGSIIDKNNLPSLSYPKTLTTEEFNKAVKLVYAKSGNVDLEESIDNLVELKIASVEYKVDTRNNPAATKNNKIIITLEEGYQFSTNRSRDIYILLNPNFKYDVETITFGGKGLNFYDGQFFWGNYGLWASGL